MKHMILASASPRRKEIFELAGLSFDVVPSHVQEVITKERPEEAVMELSGQKAWDIWKKTQGDEIVVGADTVVVSERKILGKPKNEDDAAEMLSMLSGSVHQVYTGVTVICEGKETSFYEETKVRFYEMEDQEIRDYIRTGEPMDKAGAYGIQGKAAVFIRSIEGDYYNVVGFPIARFMHEMKKILLQTKKGI